MVAVSVVVEEVVMFSITVIIKADTNQMVNVFLTKKYPMPLGMGSAVRLEPGVPLATLPHSLFASFPVIFDSPRYNQILSNRMKTNENVRIETKRDETQQSVSTNPPPLRKRLFGSRQVIFWIFFGYVYLAAVK